MELITYQSYREYKTELDNQLQKSTEGFVRIGYLLKLARDTDILKESGYQNVNEFARAEYGIDKTLVSRFININDRFSEGGNSPLLKMQYQGFGYSKLAIMMQLPEAITEELSPAFSKSEVQTIKEEYDKEHEKTDLEVLMEEKPEGQQDLTDNLEKAIWQLGHDEPELYLELHAAMRRNMVGADLQEVLAPSGEHIYTVRVPGVGRLMLSIKGAKEDVTLTNIRSGEKEVFDWMAVDGALSNIIKLKPSAQEEWTEQYGEPFPVKEEPKKEEVAPVQPKKEDKPKPKKVSKVTKAKEKPEKTESEATLGQQDSEVIENVNDIAEIVTETDENVSKSEETVQEVEESVSEQEKSVSEHTPVKMPRHIYEKRHKEHMDLVEASMAAGQDFIKNQNFVMAKAELEDVIKLLEALIDLENTYEEEE